ncbi:uncharacterized protein CG5098 isoform X3 [Ceratina calcarata]|uniref:Uncharacterized protein CG5098 isoform X3 n=1 Tax=Ceratina calcarata TaxID=156304 RepID=A0AAJ7J0D2_9HYME|nr:uncharacterized protein CG5098 isoform X3 [Ceratina calcarata]
MFMCFLITISENGVSSNCILQEDRIKVPHLYSLPITHQYYQDIFNNSEQSVNAVNQHYDLTCQNSWIDTSNGPYIFGVAPKWALSNNFMQWNYMQELVAHGGMPDVYGSCHKEGNISASDLDLTYVNQFINFLQPINRNGVANSDIQKGTVGKCLSEFPEVVLKNCKESYSTCHSGDSEVKATNLLNTNKSATTCSLCKEKSEHFPDAKEFDHCHKITDCFSSLSEPSIQNITHYQTLSKILEQYKNSCNLCVPEEDKPLNLVKNLEDNKGRCNKESEDKKKLCNYPDVKRDCAVSDRTNHSCNTESCYNPRYKGIDYGLLKFSDLNSSRDLKTDRTLLKSSRDKLCKNSVVKSDCILNKYLKQESTPIFDKCTNDKTSSSLCEKKNNAVSFPHSSLNVKDASIKSESCSEEQTNRSKHTYFTNTCKPTLTNFEDFEMSGQYPGHSRPPVGTPPPQTVWNHLTMTQGQVSGLNIHPTALSGAALSSAGFYTHPSMARASHLTSQLTPQLAHTQAPPTWHTPTVPSKSVTPSNAPGNPLFSLQMLVDNRQNQSQYRNSPGSQNTLDLSSTSEIIPENYSRIPQDIPISLTARNVDKGSRNGNIISPPIPLNGETSSDSGISSSVPTPNSVGEPVSLSTKEVTTPKITVKNFESNLKGVANIHDKIKEINVDNFAQKVINLPPSVTIERVIPDKKEPEVAKNKDTLSVIAQVPRNVLPVIVNLTSKTDKDVTDSPRRESSLERDRKIEETNVRSPKNLPKRGKKGVDSLLEKLEGGNKKLGSAENIGSVIVMPVEEKDTSSVKSMSPDRQKSKSPNREDEVVSPAFSNDDSNDNTKQRRKRKLEKPLRVSKDSKTEVEDMELEPTEPTEPRTSESVPEEATSATSVVKLEDNTGTTEQRIPEKAEENAEERCEENQPIRRRRSSESTPSTLAPANQRVRRKSSDDATEFSKVTSPKSVNNTNNMNNTNPFNEVESELEKMFAGIVEAETDVKKEESKSELTQSELQEGSTTKTENINDSVLNTSETPSVNPTDVTSTVDTKVTGKKGKKTKVQSGKRKISRSSENIFGTVGSDIPQKEIKKRKVSKNSKKQEASKKAKKNTKIDGIKEMAYDSGSNASSIRSRGPVVHVEGPRDSPLSIQVVNAPREEEEEKSKEKRKTIGNGTAGRSKRLSHQNDLDYRGKVSRAGLFSSTLSSRYDAHTTDSTWVCVFCKQGPHSVIPGDPSRPHPNLAGPHIPPGTYTVPAGVLSDLFGPYLIGKERLEDGILSADEQEITTEQKKGGKNKRSLRYAGLADQFSAKMSKKKRNSMESNINSMFTGMTALPGEEQRWEVWLHEQCAVWAAGVYMAGGRVTGLQEAVWDAAKSICDSCGLTGANIGCVKRGCKAVTHYPCALTKGWHLDTNQYIPKCNLHRVT